MGGRAIGRGVRSERRQGRSRRGAPRPIGRLSAPPLSAPPSPLPITARQREGTPLVPPPAAAIRGAIRGGETYAGREQADADEREKVRHPRVAQDRSGERGARGRGLRRGGARHDLGAGSSGARTASADPSTAAHGTARKKRVPVLGGRNERRSGEEGPAEPVFAPRKLGQRGARSAARARAQGRQGPRSRIHGVRGQGGAGTERRQGQRQASAAAASLERTERKRGAPALAKRVRLQTCHVEEGCERQKGERMEGGTGEDAKRGEEKTSGRF